MKSPLALGPVALALALGAAACGGSDGSGVLAPAPGTSASDASADGEVAIDPFADAATSDAGLVTHGDASADAALPDDRIDPIAVGHAWTYDVTVLGIYPACANGVFVSSTLSSSTLSGKTALSVQSLCKNAGVFQYSVDGDRVFSYVNGSWKTSLDSPVAQGHTWSDGFRTYAWESKGTVTTPAGTFSDCWSATAKVSFSSYTVFCRGVGPVKWHYEDGFGNGYEAILTAKSF